MIDEIRIIGGKKYKVVKTPCTCICHRFPEGSVKHVMPCCIDGYKEHLVRVDDKIKDDEENK